VSRSGEIIGTALAGLGARKVRTALIMLGPMLGVGAIVGAVGMSESAKGGLKKTLRELGTNLIVVRASDAFGGGGGGEPVLPEESVERVLRVPTVEQVTAIREVGSVSVYPTEESREYFEALPASVRVADAELPTVLDVGFRSGRWLNRADEASGSRSIVLGSELATEFTLMGSEIRDVLVADHRYGVVGILENVDLVPTVNNTAFITRTAAEADFDVESEPTALYVRVAEGTTAKSVEVLPIAIALGGSETVATEVPSSLLEAEAEVDKTLQAIVIAMGGLALVVGGVGIANVMSISVIQRSTEIGIRRALGHTRGIIATQFLIEAFLVGVGGGTAGALFGAGAVDVGARVQGWVFTLSPVLLVWAGALAVLVATVAGIYPAMKAARLEPLETLRLG